MGFLWGVAVNQSIAWIHARHVGINTAQSDLRKWTAFETRSAMVLWNGTHQLSQIAKIMFTRISSPKTVNVFATSAAAIFLKYLDGRFACCFWLIFPFQLKPVSHSSYGLLHTHPFDLICSHSSGVFAGFALLAVTWCKWVSGLAKNPVP